MPETQLTPAVNRNRNHVAISCDERRRDGLLRTAWMGIVQAFPCRPEPRGIWDESATGDDTPYKRTVEPIRAAIRAAVLSGDKKLIAATLEGARAFCRELEADFTSLVPAEGEAGVVALALEETRDEGAANEVEMALVTSPDPASAERAIGPLAAHLTAVTELLSGCRRLAREDRRLSEARARFITPRTNALLRVR
jgi:hypothetical protein